MRTSVIGSAAYSTKLGTVIFPVNFFSCISRRQQEAELKLIEEETARRVEEAIRKKVEESLNSEEIKMEIQRRLEEGRKRLLDEVESQLEKEKEAALTEARRKEVFTSDKKPPANDYPSLLLCFHHQCVKHINQCYHDELTFKLLEGQETCHKTLVKSLFSFTLVLQITGPPVTLWQNNPSFKRKQNSF